MTCVGKIHHRFMRVAYTEQRSDYMVLCIRMLVFLIDLNLIGHFFAKFRSLRERALCAHLPHSNFDFFQWF